MESLARRLIQHAARRAPGPLSERLAEEWSADMSERPPGFSRLRFAIGCCWATSIIAREHRGAAVPAVTAAVAPAHVGSYMQMGPAYSPRRTVTFMLVASLHAAVLGGLMLGLTQHLKKPAPVDFQTRIIDQERQPEPAPTIPQPNISKTTIDLPRVIDLSPIVVEDSVTAVETPPTIEVGEGNTAEIVPPDPPRAVKRVQGAPTAGFPNTSDYYPDRDIRAGRQGATAVTVCVDIRGRLTSSPSILKSSGFLSLDQAALRLATAGSGHFRPTTEDGRPVNSCYGFEIQFVLK
jgi:TonB family protein